MLLTSHEPTLYNIPFYETYFCRIEEQTATKQIKQLPNLLTKIPTNYKTSTKEEGKKEKEGADVKIIRS